MTLQEIYAKYESNRFRDLVEVSCGLCNMQFIVPKRRIYKALLKNQSDVYCAECKFKAANKTKGLEPAITLTCATCSSEVTRTSSGWKKSISGFVFCSLSCSAVYNNANAEKLKSTRKIKSKKCKTCDACIFSSNSYCTKCYVDVSITLLNTTKKDLKESKPGYTWHTTIRGHAQKIIKQQIKKKICSACGYDKHVEVCHIKSVKDFQDSATVGEINHPNNLIYLCPNCHWEFDHSK